MLLKACLISKAILLPAMPESFARNNKTKIPLKIPVHSHTAVVKAMSSKEPTQGERAYIKGSEYKDACTVKPGIKSVTPQLYFEFATHFLH